MGHANDIASLADSAVERLTGDLARIMEELRRWLERLLADGRLGEAEVGTQIEWELGGLFRDLGYRDAVSGVLDSFEEILRRNEAHLTEVVGQGFSAVGRESLGAFVNGTVDELLRLEGEARDALREAVLRGTVTNLPIAEQVDTIAKTANRTFAQAVSEVDTSIMAFHREAVVTTAEEGGVDLFRYDGPDDDVTRPFCAEHVGRIYTTGDLDSEDNGQGLWPTSRFLGGYRCRHSLSPIVPERAAELLAKHGERILGGPEARRIVLRGAVGPNEQDFTARALGQAVTREGRTRVVRRRRAA